MNERVSLSGAGSLSATPTVVDPVTALIERWKPVADRGCASAWRRPTSTTGSSG